MRLEAFDDLKFQLLQLHVAKTSGEVTCGSKKHVKSAKFIVRGESSEDHFPSTFCFGAIRNGRIYRNPDAFICRVAYFNNLS